ncbi:MAG TPA: hypothetical protein VKA70_17530 [Blastocatellia bacterium]|nr:hypothetical protein [Blastocatellia bacterium]
MRRVFACLFIMAVFPLVASPTWDNSNNSAPSAAVAFAGHTSSGSLCACGNNPGCICDPGEQPGDGLTIAPSNASGDSGSANQVSAPDIDLASGALVLALAFLFWVRMR